MSFYMLLPSKPPLKTKQEIFLTAHKVLSARSPQFLPRQPCHTHTHTHHSFLAPDLGPEEWSQAMCLCWRICLFPRKNKEAESGVLCGPLMCMQLGCIKFRCCKFLVWPLRATLPPASLRQARKLQFELRGCTSVPEPNRSSSTQSRKKSE